MKLNNLFPVLILILLFTNVGWATEYEVINENDKQYSSQYSIDGGSKYSDSGLFYSLGYMSNGSVKVKVGSSSGQTFNYDTAFAVYKNSISSSNQIVSSSNLKGSSYGYVTFPPQEAGYQVMLQTKDNNGRDFRFYINDTIDVEQIVIPEPTLSGGVYIQDITGGFKLTWNNASGAVSNYELYRSTSSGSLGSRIYSGSSTSYSDTGLSNNITYYYTAKACNESGCDTSNQDYKKYVEPVSQPSLSGGVYIQDITGGFKLTWNNASGTVSNYELYRSTSSGSLGSRIYSGSSTSYSDTGLSNNITYYYTAKACNESGCDTSNQDYKKYVAPVSNQPPSISINTINVESDGTVTVTYVISDPENGYMGTDIYLTTTSGGAITGISKQGLANRTQGTYSVTFPVAELYSLSSNSSYKIIADVFDDKSATTRTEQIFTYTYSSNTPPNVDTPPTLTIDTLGSGSDNPKTADFSIDVTASDDKGLLGIAYIVYKTLDSSAVQSGKVTMSGNSSSKSIPINVDALSQGAYKVQIVALDTAQQQSNNYWYWFQKVEQKVDVPPTLTIDTLGSGSDNPKTADFSIDVTASDDNGLLGIAYIVYKTLDSSALQSGKVTMSGNSSSKSIPIDVDALSQGAYKVQIVALDTAQQRSDNYWYWFQKVEQTENENNSTAEIEAFRQELISYDSLAATILADKNINSSLSRAEAVILVEKFLSNTAPVFKAKNMEGYFLAFADVDDTADYYASLLKLSYYVGDEDAVTPITKENSLFRPLDKVSRQEFVGIIVQGLDLQIIDNITSLGEFTDLEDVAPWALKYFNTAVLNKFISGNRDNPANPRLLPQDALTVYEAMVIFKSIKDQFEGNYKHNDNQFESASSLDLSKILHKNIGFEYEPKYYLNDAQAIEITNVVPSQATQEYCGTENAIVLSVTATVDSANSSKVSEYYWWSATNGYFREYKGSTNFKKVCFFPGTLKPDDGYKIVVNGGDNLGYIDKYVYESLNTDDLHKNDQDSEMVDADIDLSFYGDDYLIGGKAYAVNIVGGFEKSGINIGIEDIKIYLVSENSKSLVFKGEAINNKATFIPPDMAELYGQRIDLIITAHTQNAKVTRTLSNIKYLPEFKLRGKVYNSDSQYKADYVTVGDQKKFLDENNEFFTTIDSTGEVQNLLVTVHSNNNENTFDPLTVNLTYSNPKKYIVMVGSDKSDTHDSSGSNSPDTYLNLQNDISPVVQSGKSANIYGCSGENSLSIESGATARIFNFQGRNTITIESASDLFTVSRSGATVTFAGSDGTFVKVPATSNSQRISFNDIELELTIRNNQVMLGNQVIGLTPSAIGFEIYDPSNPIIIGAVDTPGSASAVTIIGQTAYVADGDSGLQVIDISDPSNPIIIGAVDTPGSASAVTIMDQIAYVADWDKGLQVIDISDPSNPVIAGSIDIPRYVDSVAINKNMAYVGGKWDSDLWVIDVSNPSNPVIVSSVDVSGQVHGITVNENMVYVANSDYFRGLEIIDVSNPVNPFIVGSIETPGLAYDVSVNGNMAYVADAHGGLQVIDVTNPANPSIMANLDTKFATSVVAAGDLVYMVSPESDYDGLPSCLKIIDVSDPSNPLEINSIDTAGYSVDVAINGNMAYVVDSDYGLTIIFVP